MVLEHGGGLEGGLWLPALNFNLTLPGTAPRRSDSSGSDSMVGMSVPPPNFNALASSSTSRGPPSEITLSSSVPPILAPVHRARPSIPLPPLLSPSTTSSSMSDGQGEGKGMTAYHESVSSHLRSQLASQLSKYQSFALPRVKGSGDGPAMSSRGINGERPINGPSTMSYPRPARQQIDLAGLAARDKEHSRAWVLEGYKRYTSALKPEEFMLDARGLGMGGGLGKRRRRRYTDGEGLGIGMESPVLGIVIEVLGGSAVVLGGEEGDLLEEERTGLLGRERKRARLGRSPHSGSCAAQALARRSFSADAELRSPTREKSEHLLALQAVPPVPTSFAEAVAAMHLPTVYMPNAAEALTHGLTPGLTSTGFTSVGNLFEMETSAFEAIQTPPPAIIHHEPSKPLAVSPPKYHAKPSFALSSDKLAITPVSPPRNREKRPSLFGGRKASSSFVTPARRTSMHNPGTQIGASSKSSANGSGLAGHTTSSSSSLASLTSASISCSQADLSPRTPATIPLALDEVLEIADAGSVEEHCPDFQTVIDLRAKSSRGLSTENVAKHNDAGRIANARSAVEGSDTYGDGGDRGGEAQVRVKCEAGAQDGFWAELLEMETPT